MYSKYKSFENIIWFLLQIKAQVRVSSVFSNWPDFSLTNFTENTYNDRTLVLKSKGYFKENPHGHN